MTQKKPSTSWHESGQWYNEAVGEKGHYYHQTLIIPQVLQLCQFSAFATPALLDLACGQGVLYRALPPNVAYLGVDIAPSLIRAASQYHQASKEHFLTADVTKPLSLQGRVFTHATLILALQNIESPLAVFRNAYQHLEAAGKFIIVLNHPCFRIPRQSSWGVDPQNKIRYRRIDRYMSPMQIPIQTHPGKGGKSPQTWSFHHPFSTYTQWLQEAGFVIERIEEWCSNKESEGKAAKMENRSREEIPLFMAISALKKS